MGNKTDKQFISVFEIVGKHFCALSGQGDLVFEKIKESFEQDKPVVLSFRKVSQATPTFLNHCIGQLYGTFSEDKIKNSLSLKDIDGYEITLINKVIKNAKRYFREKEKKNA